MNEIKCPQCGTVFKVDESGFADIVRQVRDAEFARAVEERAQLMEAEREQAVALALAQARNQAQADLSARERRIAELEAAAKTAAAQRDAQVAELQGRLAALDRSLDAEKKLAAAQAQDAAKDELRAIERQRDELRMTCEQAKAENERLRAQHQAELAEKLKAKDELIADREREIERIRDMKAKLSVKMLGESLEQHCEVAFNQLRATAFRHAQFNKDNDASGGTKGDYIYRELNEEGVEVVSIMFEMKNEADESVHRKRNEDHFKKLDKDRRDKGCEYAVLVSLLEPESELYNQGIVDVSYAYDKMYVIRPQFFIPMITLLRNAALGALEYKSQVALMRRQNIDVTNFEESLEDFKDKFGRNYRLASDRFAKAIEEIDKTIEHSAEDEGEPAGFRAQPASGERQGRSAHREAPGARQSHHAGQVRGAARGGHGARRARGRRRGRGTKASGRAWRRGDGRGPRPRLVPFSLPARYRVQGL